MAINTILPRCLVTEQYSIDPKLVPRGATPLYETDSSLPGIIQHADPATPVVKQLLQEVRKIAKYGLIDRIELFRNLPDGGRGMTLINNKQDLILHVVEARLGTACPGSELGRLILHEFRVPDIYVNRLSINLSNRQLQARLNNKPESFSVAFARSGRDRNWSYVQFK